MEVVTNNILASLHEEVRKTMNDVSDDMINGACSKYSDYTHTTGIIKGLAMAERAILDLNERLENA
jgi:hypothetical protein